MTLLVRHPDTPPGAIQAIDAELERVPGGAVATFRTIGDVSRLVIPSVGAAERTDDLWRTTCFELFIAGEGSGYREYNLSPSGAWAAYEFNDYRAGMRQASAEIEIQSTNDHRSLLMLAKIASEFPNPAHIGLTAVIEEADGLLRYW